MTGLPTLDDLDLDGRRVLVRADFNVPLEGGRVADDFRIRAGVPTLQELRARGARVVVCSHLGRPSGPDPSLTMAPVGEALQSISGLPVRVATDVAGPGAAAVVAEAGDAVVLLENTRFEGGETTNDPVLADRLAGLGEAFVMDAFGSAHRAHVSTVGLAERLPSAAGPLLLAEVAAFERILGEPARPFVVVLGGAKVADKLGVIRALLPKVDAMLVGGAMCFTLLAAQGHEVGSSPVEEELWGAVRRVLGSPSGDRVVLPTDLVVGEELSATTRHRPAPATQIPEGGVGLDIGPETAGHFSGIIAEAATVFWNGPMGVFEWEPFAAGTRRVAEAIAAGRAYSVVGGGDSVAALRRFGLSERVSHLSTGGGAGLELIAQGTLPGLEALNKQTADSRRQIAEGK